MLTSTLHLFFFSQIVGMATLLGAGVFLLCRGMVIPKDHAWNTVAVPSILIFVEFLEAALLIHAQVRIRPKQSI